MIDFIKAENIFKEYLENYDLEDGKIKLKVIHTYEVIRKSEYIATMLGLGEEDIQLAKIIALLHDIGRFEQLKQTSNFLDGQGFEHADYGVKVLFEKQMIRQFISESQYDNVIGKAIYNHNKYKIEDGLSEFELIHCKIIRDADKLDNFRVKEQEDFCNVFPNVYNPETIEYETISTTVFEDFMKHQCILLSDRKTMIDFWVCVIAFIFDLNFDVSLKYVREKGYIDTLVDRIDYKNLDTKQKMEQIRKCAKKYLEMN